MHLDKIEISSYFTLFLGVTLDHISTNRGISRFNLFEYNYIARILMEIGIWSYVDILLCIVIIYITNQSYHKILKKESKCLFIFPLLSGFIRLIVGILNISLL